MNQATINCNCPHCQQIDQVQKISAIYTGGLSNSKLSGNMRSSGTIGFETSVRINGSVNMNGQNQTHLSQKFIPPKKPSIPIGDLLKYTGITITLSFLIAKFIQTFFQLRPLNILSFLMGSLIGISSLIFSISCIIFVIILLIWIFNVYVRRIPRTTYQERLNHWQKLCTIWDAMYYCHRCDIVYNPNQPGQISSVQNASQFYKF